MDPVLCALGIAGVRCLPDLSRKAGAHTLLLFDR